MQYVQTSYYFNCANLAVCFVCPASFFSSWMCVWVCVGVVVITFLSVAPPVSPPSSGHTPAGHQLWLLTCCSLVIRLTTEGWNKHSMIARSLCQLKYALGLCLVWVLCGGVFFGWDNPSFCVDPAMKSDFSEPFFMCVPWEAAMPDCCCWNSHAPPLFLPWKTLSISLLNFYSASSLNDHSVSLWY